ncbi:MAG: D-hexose-6-phosphate mutarotase [Lentisphaeria bacterium]|nr:D-hexose-6-phosphate mutarotase [Lentisphaeria bacterium]
MNIESKNVVIENTESGLRIFHVITANSKCSFSNYGGHILSFASDGDELLWVSAESNFEFGKAIRGGIPVCWPYFGAAPIDGAPAHGFARLLEWDVCSIIDLPDGRVEVKMSLDSSKLPEFCNKLALSMTIVIGKTLQVSLTTCNQGSSDFTLSQALHTYFNVSYIGNVAVLGLEDTDYFDSLVGKICRQSGAIGIAEEVDRVYLDTDATCTLSDKGKPYQVQISKSGSRSTVVWNPWIAKSIRMADFGDEEYWNMICIETTNAKSDSRILKSGETHTMSLEISKK